MKNLLFGVGLSFYPEDAVKTVYDNVSPTTNNGIVHLLDDSVAILVFLDKNMRI